MDYIKILKTDIASLAYSTRLRKISVAVLDTGIDATHPLLKGHVIEAWRFNKKSTGEIIPQQLKKNSNNALGSHGTEIASRILLCAHNVQIIDIRVLDLEFGNGAGIGDLVLAGFQKAIDSNAKIINMSYTAKKALSGKLSVLCEQAYRKGKIVIAAKRNIPLEDDLGFPAELSSVIAVDKGEMESLAEIYYTNNPPIEFVAKGENVEVAMPIPHVSGWRFENMQQYTHRATGTSYATATTSAIVALLLGKYPDLKFFEIKTYLKYLSDHLGKKQERKIQEKYIAIGIPLDQLDVEPESFCVCPNCQTQFYVNRMLPWMRCPNNRCRMLIPLWGNKI